MKKIILYIGDYTYKAIVRSIYLRHVCEKMGLPDDAWVLILRAIEDNWEERVLQLKEDKEEIEVDGS